ncbi:hypothetical protein LAZ67_20001420 [Cordylochernes scorpioides]|uniref:Uncharacterized protein n=1 Tax=Cordylochernes scorpioides TaxID=51811 RepID=A0ABY6LKX2_9ARAC|nr:hypothetical protein LAZ67_20001420 [Cordylochernes scorpioides]
MSGHLGLLPLLAAICPRPYPHRALPRHLPPIRRSSPTGSRLDFYATTGEEAGSIPIQKKT